MGLDKLGIEHPIILAPMGGGPGTPELVAAVSNAGGLGSFAAGYLSPEQITQAIDRIRTLTDRPFNVNLFAGGYERDSSIDPAEMLALLAEVHRTWGLPAPALPALPPNPFREQLQAVLKVRPAVFSFTFGVPDADVMSDLRSSGIPILGTATTIEEGRILKDAGADAIVAQGAEAGAHRGTFTVPFEQAMVPTAELVRGIAAFAPVIASGGIMNGQEIATMCELGASAAQLGTAFLTCPESGAAEAYKQALLASTHDTTVITRAFSGRPARGLPNAFIARLEGKENAILRYPLQNSLTGAMRAAAAKRGDPGFLSLWAGQGVARCRVMPARDLVARLVEEMRGA